MKTPASWILQAAKLGDLDCLLKEMDNLPEPTERVDTTGRVYGLSGGSLCAAGFALALSAIRQPEQFLACKDALSLLRQFLVSAKSSDLRQLNLNPSYGFYNLRPLRAWLLSWLRSMEQDHDLMLSTLPIPLYICAADRDGTLTLFGPQDDELSFQYGFVRVGPPEDACLVDALIAAVSTAISTEPAKVNRDWYRDVRPAIPDGRAIVSDLEASDPRPILCQEPHTPLPDWKLNWITSSFIMHRHHERNQSLLARYYLDLLERHRRLESRFEGCGDRHRFDSPEVHHIDLPYIGSTEAFTNLRQSVAQKESLMARFRELLDGQFADMDFSTPANVIYGAGGFSGILAGLVTTRDVDAGFRKGGGRVRQVYGVSAGVLNGFFHAVQLAAERRPDLYTPAAQHALADLEDFMASVSVSRVAKLNLNPRRFWQGWANLGPLREFLQERLSVYTDSEHPAQLTFDELKLPMTVAAAREDGFTDFLGMSKPRRQMQFGETVIEVKPAPVVEALIAGWSMNTYVEPTRLGYQRYSDGGGAFYDIGLFVACMDDDLVSLLNIHLDEPEGHSYNIPAKPSIVRVIFDTHNYTFPEERRRMRALTDLLYEHFCCRKQAAECGYEVGADFRQDWRL